MKHKHLLIFILSFLSFLSIHSQITGSWMADWQNPNSNEQPINITISQDSDTTLNATYSYQSSAPSSFILTENTTTGAWVDSTGAQLVYNSTTETIVFTNLSVSQYSVLFDRNGSYYSPNRVYGLFCGNYSNPVPITGSDCDMPFSIQILQNELKKPLQVSVVNQWENPSQDLLFPIIASILQAGVNNILYYVPLIHGKIEFSLTGPYNQIIVSYGSCTYQYTKSGSLISGKWTQDWQTSSYNFLVTEYEINIVDGLYMMANCSSSQDNSTNPVYLLSENLFFDPNMFFYLIYSPEKNALLAEDATELGRPLFILSSNGSLFDPTPFISKWSNPENYDGTPTSQETCCVPSSIEISKGLTNSTLQVVYTFPSNYTQNPYCHDYLSYANIENNQLSSSLSIQNFNFYGLYWSDSSQNQISFLNSYTTSEILVTMAGQCSFVMDNYNANGVFALSMKIIPLILAMILLYI